MSQYLHELCCLLVEEFYGAFHASIYATLTPSGRYNASQVAHKLHLPIRQVKSGLATLVQCRLVYHHTSVGLTTYQANTRSAYNLIRCGKLVELARSRHGPIAGTVITQACLLGFSTLSELVSLVTSKMTTPNKPTTNGHHSSAVNDWSDQESICKTIELLLKDRFLINIRPAQLQCDFDALGDAEVSLSHANILRPAKGRKALIEYETKVAAEMHSMQSVEVAEHGYTPKNSIANGISNSEGRPTKRRRVSHTSTEVQSNGHPSNNLTGESAAESTALVGLSYHNVVRNIRDDYVTAISTKTLGPRSSAVMQTVLSQSPITEQWLSALLEPILNTQEIMDLLNEDTDNEDRHLHNGYSTSSIDHTSEDYSRAEVEHHLELLSESLFPFIETLGDDSSWKINKQSLDDSLKQRETLRLVGDRLQPPALRILRMLISKGKLDEKTLQEAGLLGAKQLRQMLAELKQMGYVDLQEVPREAQRQPNRTIFLWFHDPQRVCQLLLENLYKTMTRMLQRLKTERRKLGSTLEKVERSDVQGSEEQILSPAELKVLRRLERTEGWLLGEIGRLDASVAILRDL